MTKNIVILGAGFGGIAAALRIAKRLKKLALAPSYRVTIIDRNDDQLYTPVLYEYAAAAGSNESPMSLKLDIRSLIANLPITFMKGEVEKIDLTNGDIHLKSGERVKAEYLVIALGSEINHFGIPGLAEHSIPLKTFNDAKRIRETLEKLLKTAPKPHIVVGGAGANGIELAAQIKFLHPKTAVTLVEAMPDILPGFTGSIIQLIRKRLTKLGIAVTVNSKITSVEPGLVKLDGGSTIPFDLLAWTGGIKTPDLVSKLPLQNDHGKPVAQSCMDCVPQTPDLKLYPMVYGLGDSVCAYNEKTKRPLPATAPVALSQAKIVAHNVIEEIRKAEVYGYIPKNKDYKAKEFPYVIPVGGRSAIAKIGPFLITGFAGWLFKKIVELDYLIGLYSLRRL
jgi:NADH dehydrogenase